jgi:hypothetical protein
MTHGKINLAAVFTTFIFALAFAPSIAAAKNNQGKGGPKGDHAYERPHHDSDDDEVTIAINFGDRERIENYMRSDIRRNCPPGLAKKNPPCIPPGQAKKWRVGYPLPDDVVFYPVGRDLLDYLSPVPRGYTYVQVDKDVLLIAEASKKVIDAVTLLSAVGN